MKYYKDGHEARRVDAYDYDRLCALAAWCGGRAIDEDDDVIALPTPTGEARAQHADWIIQDAAGVFHVYAHPEWRPIADGWPWFLTQAADGGIR